MDLTVCLIGLVLTGLLAYLSRRDTQRKARIKARMAELDDEVSSTYALAARFDSAFAVYSHWIKRARDAQSSVEHDALLEAGTLGLAVWLQMIAPEPSSTLELAQKMALEGLAKPFVL